MSDLFEGGCHCGAVRLRIRLTARRALRCNCSICTKKGFLHLIVKATDFELLSGEEALTDYRFNTRVARHLFCRHCGIHAFYRPRSHPEDYSVNLRCLEGPEVEDFEIVPFDGENWEDAIETIRS